MIQETYKISKELINKEIDDIKNEKTTHHNDQIEAMMMFLIALSKILIIKQNVVLKNKKEKTLTNLFPKRELDEMVYKGIFRTIDSPIDIKRTKHKEKPIKIIDIEENRDSAWIIDNIRDSLAHNNFEIDYEQQVVHINNKQRKLVCDIDFYWLIEFSFIINTNKIESDYNILKIQPLIYEKTTEINTMEDILKQYIKNNKSVKELIQNVEVYMYKIELKDNLTQEEIRNLKFEINKYWEREATQIIKTCKEENIKKIIERINKKYSKYITKIERTNVTKQEEYKYIERRIQEFNNFFNIEQSLKKEIILKMLSLHYYNYNEKNEIVEGLDNIMATDYINSNEMAKKYYMIKPEEYQKNKYCYKKEKLLAALYLLGTSIYTLYKEKIFDKTVSYEEIDTSKIKAYDIETPIKLKKQKDEISKKILKNQEYQNVIIKRIKNLEKYINKNQEKLEKIINESKQTLNNIQKEKEKLLEEKIKIQENMLEIKIEDNIEYKEINNQELMRHIRNALAHTWMSYDDTSSTNLMNRIVELKDYNEKHELTFIARAQYKTWMELFNNKIFEDAINTYYEYSFEHTLVKK